MGSCFEVAICDLKRLGRWRRMVSESNERDDLHSSIVPADRIEQRILLIRGEKVILDVDLAALYGVTT
jgi:hypothetical protein